MRAITVPSEVVVCDITFPSSMIWLISVYTSPRGPTQKPLNRMKLGEELQELIDQQHINATSGYLNEPQIDWDIFRGLGIAEDVHGLAEFVTESIFYDQRIAPILCFLLCFIIFL